MKRFFNSLLVVATLLCCIGLFLIFYQISHQNIKVPIPFLPILIGVIYEDLRVGQSFKSLWSRLVSSLLFSYVVFFDKKSSFEFLIEIWLIVFGFFFITFSVVANEDKIMPRLSEGITLLQTIALGYFLIFSGILNEMGSFSIFIIGLSSVGSIVSVYYALSKAQLTDGIRLFLSIWSTIIMLIFGINYLYESLTKPNDLLQSDLDKAIFYFGYFLLGNTLIYIYLNGLMVFQYLPMKREEEDDYDHSEVVGELNELHIKRYSSNQASLIDSLLAICCSVFIYYLNIKHQFISVQGAIWLLFFIFPYLIWLKNKLNKI